MRAEWRTLGVADDMRIRGKRITVSFANERSHGVQVLDEGDSYLLTAVVADADDLDPEQDAARAAWRRNRHSSLVGFRIDEEGRLIDQAWTPKDGLTPKAFRTLVRAVAREADRYEFQLTGSDDR